MKKQEKRYGLTKKWGWQRASREKRNRSGKKMVYRHHGILRESVKLKININVRL